MPSLAPLSIHAKNGILLNNQALDLAWIDSGAKLGIALIGYSIVFFIAYSVSEMGFFLQLILVPIFTLMIGFVGLIYLGLLTYLYKFAVGIESLMFGIAKRFKRLLKYFKLLPP